LPSQVTARANALVAERLPEARGLGLALAELIDDPERFVAVLRDGLLRLSDEDYSAGLAGVAPTSDPVIAVRAPLQAACQRQLRRPLRQGSAASALSLAQRLAVEPEREMRLFSLLPLERALPADAERSWQLLRQLAGKAVDWISVDVLAGVYAAGILAEPFRWAELEQLVYSADRWERRLVGSTIASMPHQLPRARRQELARSPALTLIKSLIGDNEPDVQKALSWALRSWWNVDPFGTRELIRSEAHRAHTNDDGQRAWVLRDALSAPAIDAGFVAEIRAQLAGIRRRPGGAPTSTAAEVAARFAGNLHGLTDKALAQQGERMAAGR
jgi:3-methyladenine DNA glycosylase AlkD